MEERDNFFEKLINYEARMMQIFKELELKPNQCQLIRAFLIASKGKTEFEASFSELDALTNKKRKSEGKTANVRNALKTLLEWQDKNQIELIRVVRKGQQFKTNEGIINYQKSKYRFILVSNLAEVLYSDSENFEIVFEELISKIRAEYKPALKLRKYHPNHNLTKVRKTIETKFKRTFELAKEAGKSPTYECKKVFRNVLNILRDLVIEETEKENREKFITEFESSLGLSEIDEELEVITG